MDILIHSSDHEILMILINCAVLFQAIDELALEAGLAPAIQTQISLSQSVFLQDVYCHQREKRVTLVYQLTSLKIKVATELLMGR